MRHERWVWVVVMLLVGCASGTAGGSSASTTGPVPATPVGSAQGSAPSSLVDAGADAQELSVGAGGQVSVSGGLLPSSVSGAVTSRGGELADVASWDARYETYGLPRVAGPGVRLVAGEIEATAVDGGWQRRDALQWLLMDVSHPSLGAILDDLAAAAGIGEWQASESSEVVGSGDCLERTFTSTMSSTSWKLSGCSYPDMAGMFAVAVERRGVFANAPSPVDPSVSAVAAAVGGQLSSVAVFFGAPTTSGSATTLTVTATVVFAGTAEDARSTLEVGPLEGWRASPGNGSVMYAGGVGARWVVSGGEAVFTAVGRLAS